MPAVFTPTDVDTDPFDLIDTGDVFCPSCGEAFSPLFDECADCNSKLQRASGEFSADDPLLGVVLDGRYRIVAPLSSGAMGVIYEGVQLSVKRPIAIKVVRAELLRDETFTERFLREAKLSTQLSHPNIVDVFDYGETEDGCFYIVMELLRGESLDVMLAQRGSLDVRSACDIALQICDALAAAHSHGVVHRDLKPANIIVLPELGHWVKVLDFGLAKSLADPASEVTEAGTILGTPLYMSPELIREGIVDPRGDLYALGCILFELLAGEPPFPGATSALVIVRQLDDLPPALPANVPLGVAHLVASLLAKNPDERPPSALVVREALEVCIAAELGWLSSCSS
jgi:serine/threonine-protein kinase